MISKAWSLARTPVRIILTLFVFLLLMHRSVLPPSDETEQVRFYTRDREFDYVSWTLNAFWVKFNQSALGLNRYMTDDAASENVVAFIEMTRRIQIAESELRTIYADPAIEDKEAAAREVDARLAEDYALRAQLGPLAESILQAQVIAVLRDQGIDTAGHAFPPVLYHMTPAPMALVVSPRDEIVQRNNISLQPEMSLEEQVALEDAVAEGLDLSTLVVPIGGVGVYPTMVTQSSNLNWLADVIAHEWAHNYLSLRPLGLGYLESGALRTMNETAASIFGGEVGRRLIERFYPAFAPPPPEPEPPPAEEEETTPPPEEPGPPPFDFRAEMRETRVNVDRLLQEGEIELAEQYMELRRLFFWDNGYRIRKLNQAYFAFYGAYADTPGGAAGDDPVAAAVRELWDRSDSLADFIRTIAWMGSFEELEGYLAEDV